MARRTTSILAITLTGFILSSCTIALTDATPISSNSGVVVGVFKLVGGPPPGVSIPTGGTVIFVKVLGKHSTMVTASFSVGSTGHFTVRIPPGRYEVTGNSPKFIVQGERGLCGSVHPINIKAKERTSVFVQCDIP